MARRSKRRIGQRFLLFTHIGICIALLISNVARFISPTTILFPSFLGLAFLPIFLCNLLFTLLWLFFQPKYAAMGFVVLLLSWSNLQRHVVFWPQGEVSEAQGTAVMSFNVRLFDLYNWGGNKESRDEILRYLIGRDQDVLCFQEFFNTNDPSYFNTLDTLKKSIRASVSHDEYSSIIHKGKHKFGIATLAAFDVIHRERIPFDTAANNLAIYTDMVMEGDTIRIFNLHLASVYISSIEEKLEEHIEENDQDAQLAAVGHMIRNIASGFKRRANQAEVIRAYIDASPYPVIVCADLNDTPSSYSYRRIRGDLNDAFLQKGYGWGESYIGRIRGLRIDYIFVDPRIEVLEFTTDQVELSDHRPLLARVRMRAS